MNQNPFSGGNQNVTSMQTSTTIIICNDDEEKTPLEKEELSSRDYVIDVLRKLNVKDVEKAKQGSGMSLKYKFRDDVWKGLIAASLVKTPDGRYTVTLGKRLDRPEALIVAINRADGKFAIGQRKFFPATNLTLNFAIIETKYREFMVESEEKFVTKLLEMLDVSCIYEEPEKYRISQVEKAKDNTAVGDASEVFVFDTIKGFKDEIE